jgi:hypothetical protein
MDNTDLNRIAFLLLGGLLSVLWPVVTDAIKRRRENALAKQAMRAELNEVGHKLALAAHYIDMHQGTVSRESLEWLRSHLERYAGVHQSDSILEFTRLQLSWPEEKLRSYVASETANPSRSIALQKYGIPMLDSRIAALWSLETTLQRQLLEIRTDVDLLNDLVDRARHYSDMTFSKLEGNNYSRVTGNLEQVYSEYAKRARSLVDRTTNARGML